MTSFTMIGDGQITSITRNIQLTVNSELIFHCSSSKSMFEHCKIHVVAFLPPTETKENTVGNGSAQIPLSNRPQRKKLPGFLLLGITIKDLMSRTRESILLSSDYCAKWVELTLIFTSVPFDF